MSTHLSSRLARRQQRRFLRQTILIGVASVVLVIVFIFFILPNFIRIFFNLTDGTQQALVNAPGLPPQAPVFSAPPDATQSAQISVNGFAQANTQIVLMLNGSQADKKAVASDGTFQFDVNLSDGENKVAAFAVDDSKQESEVSQTYTIVKDNQPPSLDISQPQDNQTVTDRKNQMTTVSGKTDPATHLTLNDHLIYVQDDGSFTTTYQLQEGDNQLHFVAQDKAGNQTTKDLKVTFSF